VNRIDKLTVRYRIPFFQFLSISHQTFNTSSGVLKGGLSGYSTGYAP
jgi:hypothetical protein